VDATDIPADEAEAPDLADVEFRLRKARAGIPLSVFCGLGLAVVPRLVPNAADGRPV